MMSTLGKARRGADNDSQNQGGPWWHPWWLLGRHVDGLLADVLGGGGRVDGLKEQFMSQLKTNLPPL